MGNPKMGMEEVTSEEGRWTDGEKWKKLDARREMVQLRGLRAKRFAS